MALRPMKKIPLETVVESRRKKYLENLELAKKRREEEKDG